MQHPVCGDFCICAGIKQNGILAGRLFHLNDGVSCWTISDHDMIYIDSGRFEKIPEENSILANHSGMKGCNTCSGKGDGLILTFTAGIDFVVSGTQRFPRRDKMIHVINVINIQRTEIQNLHILKLPACAEVI